MSAVLFGLLSCSDIVLSFTGDLQNDPAEVVKKYARLDYKGVRLEAISQEALHPYIAWTDEPVWRTVVVVDNYRVLDHTKDWDIINLLDVVIPVEYAVVGTVYWETAAFLPNTHVERVRFRVKAMANRWRLLEPLAPPYVGRKRMINFVRQRILQETNLSRLAILTTLREDLEKAEYNGR